MFPPAHPAVAYLVYSGARRVRGEVPGARPTVALVAGSVLPDLIDQPLYYAVGASSTRTLGHSLLTAVPVCLLALIAVRRSRLPDPVATGFVVGYLVHVATDAVWPLALGLYGELGYLLWPATYSPPYAGEKSLFDAGGVMVTTRWIELPLLVFGALVWRDDGFPGVRTVWARLGG